MTTGLGFVPMAEAVKMLSKKYSKDMEQIAQYVEAAVRTGKTIARIIDSKGRAKEARSKHCSLPYN